jgi:hypothetical protein
MLKGGTGICGTKLQLARPVLPRRSVWEGDSPKRVWYSPANRPRCPSPQTFATEATEPPSRPARANSLRANSNRSARKYAIGVVFRNRRNPSCNALLLTPATPAKSSRLIAHRAFSSMKRSTRRTKYGAIDGAAASKARPLLWGIETSRVDISAEAMRSLTSGCSRCDDALPRSSQSIRT